MRQTRTRPVSKAPSHITHKNRTTKSTHTIKSRHQHTTTRKVNTTSKLQKRPFASSTNSKHTKNIDTPDVVSNKPLSFSSSVTGQGLDYRLFIHTPQSDTSDLSTIISPWHDIPLYHTMGKTYHYINEIPRGTTAKFEIDTTSEHNPLKQDTKNGQLRFFKYGKIPFNYGALPQTWEDPSHIDKEMKLGGDNDPVDIVEMSPGPLQQGGIYQIKVVGALALIDEGEVDWKILAINASHPVAHKLTDVTSLETVLPGFEHKVKEWFTMYKTADGKPENKLGYNGKLLSKSFAEDIITQTHKSWKGLVDNGPQHTKLWVRPPRDERYVVPNKKLDEINDIPAEAIAGTA